MTRSPERPTEIRSRPLAPGYAHDDVYQRTHAFGHRLRVGAASQSTVGRGRYSDRMSQEGPVTRAEIVRRRAYTEQRWDALDLLASKAFGDLADVEGQSCIYVTGSMARDEATEGSDLDLFIIDQLSDEEKPLTLVQSAHLIAHLDEVRDDAGFRAFSRGGEFIKPHPLASLLELIGDPQDDAENAFTARILLLINSRALTNVQAYEEARKRILNSYWQPQHPTADFRPVMLVNDVRRWWSVLCLNFERYNKQTVVDEYTARSGVERRIANLKLRYARLLGAFTPLLGFIVASDQDGVLARKDAEAVLDATPIQRLEDLEGDESIPEPTRLLVSSVLDRYDTYLQLMREGKDELQRFVSDDRHWHPTKAAAYEFHEEFVRLYRAVGESKVLYDYSLI